MFYAGESMIYKKNNKRDKYVDQRPAIFKYQTTGFGRSLLIIEKIFLYVSMF